MGIGQESDGYDWLYAPDAPRTTVQPSNPGSRSEIPPPVLPKTSATKQKRRRKGGFFRLLMLLFVAWLIFMIAVPLVAWQDIARIDADPGFDRPASGATTTFIVAGTDARPNDRSRGRTDTIMLLTFGSGPTVLTSIPRDSLVQIPGHGRTKVNAAYAYGGAPLLVQTLEAETGLRIIEVCPERELKDKDSKLDIKAGCQIVDGKTALAYSRNRKSFPTGDIARGQSQREVIGGIGTAVLTPATFLNPLRWAQVNNSAASAIAVSENVSMIEFARFAWALSNAMSGAGVNCTVPIRDLRVTWDAERANSYFTHLRNGTAEQLGALCTDNGLEE